MAEKESGDPTAAEAKRRTNSLLATAGVGNPAEGDVTPDPVSDPKLLEGYFEGKDYATPEEHALAKTREAFMALGRERPPAPEPEPDPRLGALINKEVAAEIADATKMATDRIAVLKAEAEEALKRAAALRTEADELDSQAEALAGKTAAARRRQAGTKRGEADSLTAESQDKSVKAETLRASVDEEANQYLKSKEAGYIEDAGEAEERAYREDRLQMAELEAAKSGRVEVARALAVKRAEQSDSVGESYQARQKAIAGATAKGVVDVDEMLAAGKGYWKVDFSGVDPEDQLQAARGVEELIGRHGVPDLELSTDNGHVRELIYHSDKKDTKGVLQPLVIVERWDNITGKLISLNTIVAAESVREGWTAKLWKGKQVLPSREVEAQMDVVRSRDLPWRLQAGNAIRNSDPGFMIGSMAYMRVPEDDEWAGKPPKKSTKKHWWQFDARPPKPRA